MTIPIKALSEPFAANLIKQRRGNFGKKLDYAEAITVIQRLNAVMEGAWSFTIIGYRIETEEVIVHGELKIAGEVHQQFGGSSITRNAETGVMLSLADDLKAAASDALKKCASAFGVGLYLYKDSTPVRTPRPRPEPPTRVNGNGNGNGHLTQEMVGTLLKQGQEAGFSQADLIGAAKRLYDKPLGQLTVVQAQDLVKDLIKSKEAIRA